VRLKYPLSPWRSEAQIPGRHGTGKWRDDIPRMCVYDYAEKSQLLKCRWILYLIRNGRFYLIAV
jgi:hypothetical protein